MTELNGKEFKIKIIDDYCFSIGDTKPFAKCSSDHFSGFVTRVNKPQKIEFLEFSEALKTQSTMKQQADMANQNQQIILSFIALQKSLEKSDKNSIKTSGNELFEFTQKVNSKYKIVDEIDERLVHEFARKCGTVISPMCSIIGGIVSQEIIKFFSSKFCPIHQFLSIDYTKSLPKDTNYELKNDRYDQYRIIFGNKQQEMMEKLRCFILGSGSTGSELLKNLAFMGVGTKNDGKIVIIDNKEVKKSNLNRNFLFKNEDIGRKKSEVAAQSIHSINPEIKIEAKTEKIQRKN